MFGAFLASTGLDHPAREEALAVRDQDWRVAVSKLFEPLPDGARIFYQKQHVHHLAPVKDRSWIRRLFNVFLIRDPRRVVESYVRIRPEVTLRDIAVREQLALFENLAAVGPEPIVIDADDLLASPESYLRALCAAGGVEFDARMLSWPSGPRDTDGPWGRYWYQSLWRSTGFEPSRPSNVPLEGRARDVAEAALPYYEQLHARRLQPSRGVLSGTMGRRV